MRDSEILVKKIFSMENAGGHLAKSILQISIGSRFIIAHIFIQLNFAPGSGGAMVMGTMARRR